jgi:predicted ATPase/DNA-binding XRE family transcriptional regulator
MEEQYPPVVFNEWLKRRRKALDMTQDELAARAGCSVSALRKIEHGERRPSKQLAALLAKALEIPQPDQPTFIRVARGELGLARLGQPSPEPARPAADTANLMSAGGASLRQAPPAAPFAQQRLPLQATPLVGREAELAAMQRLFNDPQCRLLTLTGIGGIGKTRLAIEFALRNQIDFPGGVFYIPLTPVLSSEEIAPAIAEVLGFSFSGPADPKEQLLSYLASHTWQETLLIFDNLEHLLVEAAPLGKLPSGKLPSDNLPGGAPGVVGLTAEILQRLPEVKILGTSRERLNIRGEWTYELHGLSVPPADFLGRLEDYNSIALFLQSARRIRPDFGPDFGPDYGPDLRAADAEQHALIRIASLVEGVPLAIELAAAWVGILSCQEIAREIQSNIDFLTTSMRDVPERHRSIRAAFEHSWKLLLDEERDVLCQLAVFRGGFDRHAAQQIAGASLPLLASLSAKSLLRRTESSRYDLHEVIRQCSLTYLHERPGHLETYARHCQHYLGLVQEKECQLKSGAQQEAIQQLTGEIDNIRAAWVWAIEHKRFDLLGQAGRGFGWYLEITSLYREGIEQLELLVQALKSVPQDGPLRRLLGLTLIHQALLYFRKGEFEQARQLYAESIRILRPAGDQALLADALVFIGTIHHLQGDYQEARLALEEGWVLARQCQEPWFEAWAVYNIGHVASLVGQYEQGYEQMLAGLRVWRELGDPQAIALGLNFMVTTLNKLGRFAEAKAFMHESIALSEHSKNRWGMGTAYRYLGLVYLAEGQPGPAREHLLKSLEIFGEFAVGWDIARSLTYLGDAALLAGDDPQAREMYRDGLQASIDAQAFPIALDALAGLGELDARSGKPESALLFCRVIQNHPSSEDETKRRAGQLEADLCGQLDPGQIQSIAGMAKQKSLEAIAREALG